MKPTWHKVVFGGWAGTIPSGGRIIFGKLEGIPLIIEVGAAMVVGSWAMLVGGKYVLAESVPVGEMVCGCVDESNVNSGPALEVAELVSATGVTLVAPDNTALVVLMGKTEASLVIFAGFPDADIGY